MTGNIDINLGTKLFSQQVVLILIDRLNKLGLSRQNLSSGFRTKGDSNHSPQLQSLS